MCKHLFLNHVKVFKCSFSKIVSKGFNFMYNLFFLIHKQVYTWKRLQNIFKIYICLVLNFMGGFVQTSWPPPVSAHPLRYVDWMGVCRQVLCLITSRQQFGHPWRTSPSWKWHPHSQPIAGSEVACVSRQISVVWVMSAHSVLVEWVWC